MKLQSGAPETNLAYIAMFQCLCRPETGKTDRMEDIMKTWLRIPVAAAIAATIGFGASAALAGGAEGCDSPHHGMHGTKHRMDPATLTERADRRLETLEQALAIRPEQRAAWDQFGSVLRGNAEKFAERVRTMREEGRPESAIGRMARMEAFGEERMAAMREMRVAAEQLYGALDEAQQKTFDGRFHAFDRGPTGFGHRRGPTGHGGWQGPENDV